MFFFIYICVTKILRTSMYFPYSVKVKINTIIYSCFWIISTGIYSIYTAEGFHCNPPHPHPHHQRQMISSLRGSLSSGLVGQTNLPFFKILLFTANFRNRVSDKEHTSDCINTSRFTAPPHLHTSLGILTPRASSFCSVAS